MHVFFLPRLREANSADACLTSLLVSDPIRLLRDEVSGDACLVSSVDSGRTSPDVKEVDP